LRIQVISLILCFALSYPAFAEIYSYIDSLGRLTYTSDPSDLPEGKQQKRLSSGNEQLQQGDSQAITGETIRLEYLNQQLELTNIEFDNKFEILSGVPAYEYDQTAQDIQSLKIEIVELNEELIALTATNSDDRELRLQRLYAWSDKIDLLLEKDRQTNGPQARHSRLEIISLSVEEVKHSTSSVTFSVIVEVDNPGEQGMASVKVAGKGVDGHVIESKTLKGDVGRDELKTLYDTVVIEPGSALHISEWEVIEATIH